MKQQKKKKGRSVQDLLGIRTFTKYGLSTNKGELLFYLVSPTNISVLSHTNIEIKIRHLMMVLSALRQEERNGAKIDFVVAMLRGGELDEKIAKYARLDIEKVREVRAVWEDMTKGESEQKSRAMITRIGECYWLRGSNSERKQMAKRIEKMEIPHDRKRYLLQMLGYDPGKEKEK